MISTCPQCFRSINHLCFQQVRAKYAAAYCKAPSATEGQCCERRSLLREKVSVAREGQCCERRPVLREKVSAAREGQCCERRSLLREKVGAAREGQCCERRSVLREKASAARDAAHLICTALLSIRFARTPPAACDSNALSAL